MIKFLHAADLHLDSPFASLPPDKAAARRREQRQLLDELVSLCDEEGCDLLLLAGDLFDAEAARRDTWESLTRSLRNCRARVFIAPGNHDFCAPGSPYCADWPDNVHIFRDPVPAPVALDGLNAVVWGAAFSSSTSGPLLEGFRVDDPDQYNLMVLHGDAATPSSPYNPITAGQIAGSGLDYLALGHIHAASGARTAGKTVYAWPGCAMGRGFDELGEKGVYLGTLADGGCALTFRPLSGRRYEILQVEAGDDPLSAIEAKLPPHTEHDIYRVILTGPAEPPNLRALERELSPRFFGLTLRDETTPVRDLWAEAGEDGLKSLFLNLLSARRESDPALYDLAARLGVAAMEGWEVLDR